MEKIRIENLSFTYPLGNTEALKDINLKVNPSEFVVICGKSGCGKSTLLRHMKKSLIPYGARKGKVFCNGVEIDQISERENAESTGYVLQNPDNQVVTDKVWHELAFGLENLGLPNYVIKRRVAEMAGYFGIGSWFRKNVAELSGGQKQLLNLASVMAMQPELLVLDEPASQLDPIAASEFLNTVYKINRNLGVTVIISEHRLEEVFPMADRVIVMDEGKIISDAPPAETGRRLEKMNHPMQYGMPETMRIFPAGTADPVPLTIREGRITAEKLLQEIPKVERIGSKTEKSKQGLFSLKGREEKDRKSIFNKKTSLKEPVVSAENVWFRYKKDGADIVRGMELSLEKGKFHCLLGGNGSGKSTTLKLIAGIIKPQKGKIKIADNARVAMVPQNPQALFTEITVEEELIEGMAYMKLSDEEKIKRTEDMLRLMEIEHLRKANPYDLSGGEQQRLATGKVMLLEPEVLLLDEPSKGLDPFFKRTLGEVFRKLTESGTTLFMVSHDIEFCANFGDTCAMFFDGEVVSMSETKEFFKGNNFYTTTANRILRVWNRDIITCEEARAWIRENI